MYGKRGRNELEQMGPAFMPDATPIDKAMGKPGRMREAAPISGHVYPHKTDIYEHEKRVFAKDIANMVNKRAQEFDQLIVIAAPLVLGELRKNFDCHVKAKIDREIDKDMTMILPQKISDYLFTIPLK